jgi:hypothetical protein
MATDLGADRHTPANRGFLDNDSSEHLHGAAVGRRGDWLTGSMNSADNSLTLALGNHELVVRQRYEVLSIANDILIGLWFIVGSALFFSPSTAATVLFLIGSVQMIVRPLIRLTRRIHLGRIGSGEPRETARDF